MDVDVEQHWREYRASRNAILQSSQPAVLPITSMEGEATVA